MSASVITGASRPRSSPKFHSTSSATVTQRCCCCRDVNGTGEPPFAVFVGDKDASSPGSYTVLDNTNCSAYSVQFTANSQVLAVPCTRQGRYVVIRSTIGPLVLCEVQVYGGFMLSTDCDFHAASVLCCSQHSVVLLLTVTCGVDVITCCQWAVALMLLVVYVVGTANTGVATSLALPILQCAGAAT